MPLSNKGFAIPEGDFRIGLAHSQHEDLTMRSALGRSAIGVISRRESSADDQFGGPFSDHHRRGIRIASDDARHDRCIGHAQSRHAPYP